MASKPAKGAPAGYTVGRGKPPRHSQFKPGQSGNPGGRKKGSQNVSTLVRQAMESPIELTINGVTQEMPMLKALVLGLAQQGLRGNIKAMELAIAIAERHCDSPEEDIEELAEEDHAILARSLKRAGKRRARGPRKGGAEGASARAERLATAQNRDEEIDDAHEAGDE
jgi:hypothetical protein